MSWHKVSLTVRQVNSGAEMALQDQFNAIFMALGGPKSMALFSSKLDSKGVDLYFSPGSFPSTTALIETYSGKACEKPERNAVVLLVGHADAKDALL